VQTNRSPKTSSYLDPFPTQGGSPSFVYISQVLIVVVVQIDHQIDQKCSFQEQEERRRLDCSWRVFRITKENQNNVLAQRKRIFEIRERWSGSCFF
jgi:hypothetical protein